MTKKIQKAFFSLKKYSFGLLDAVVQLAINLRIKIAQGRKSTSARHSLIVEITVSTSLLLD